MEVGKRVRRGGVTTRIREVWGASGEFFVLFFGLIKNIRGTERSTIAIFRGPVLLSSVYFLGKLHIYPSNFPYLQICRPFFHNCRFTHSSTVLNSRTPSVLSMVALFPLLAFLLLSLSTIHPVEPKLTPTQLNLT
jgi:hypothetical protein